jgi:hypothetical protein
MFMLETKKSTGRGEVRFWRVFNPKTQFNPVSQCVRQDPETPEELTEERSNIRASHNQKTQVNPIEFSTLKLII